MKLKDIKKFERQNPQISVNVLGYDDENKSFYPLEISKKWERKYKVNLLLLKDKHYVLINNMSRLFISQMTNIQKKDISA